MENRIFIEDERWDDRDLDELIHDENDFSERYDYDIDFNFEEFGQDTGDSDHPYRETIAPEYRSNLHRLKFDEDNHKRFDNDIHHYIPLVSPELNHQVLASSYDKKVKRDYFTKNKKLNRTNIVVNTIFSIILVILMSNNLAFTIFQPIYYIPFGMVFFLLLFQIASLLLQKKQKSFSIIAPICFSVILLIISIIHIFTTLEMLQNNRFQLPGTFYISLIAGPVLHIIYIVLALLFFFRAPSYR